MYQIRPTTMTEAMLWGSNIPENDYSATEYNPSHTYAINDYCIDLSSFPHKIYKSLQNSNTGNAPALWPTWWNDEGATNRCAIFDNVVGHQSAQATNMTWILEPGILDSCALHNLEAGTYRLSISDSSTDLIIKESTEWAGATGTTQPTGWDKVGAASNFTIDSDGALKITAASAGDGISKTMTVVAGTDMQIIGRYRNTAGDAAQYAIHDVTNGVDILAATDLDSFTGTENSVLSYIFTVPTGCTSIKVSLLAKSAGDIVWFDTASLMECVYDTTETSLVSTIAIIDYKSWFFEPISMATDIVKSDIATSNLPPFLTTIMTLTLTTGSGTPAAGELVFGLKRELGGMMEKPEYTYKNYDTVEENDTFGGFTIVPRTWAKRIRCSIVMKTNIYDEVNKQMTIYRSTPTTYVGLETSSSLIVYGIIGEFSNVRVNESYSEASTQILGLI